MHHASFLINTETEVRIQQQEGFFGGWRACFKQVIYADCILMLLWSVHPWWFLIKGSVEVLCRGKNTPLESQTFGIAIFLVCYFLSVHWQVAVWLFLSVHWHVTVWYFLVCFFSVWHYFLCVHWQVPVWLFLSVHWHVTVWHFLVCFFLSVALISLYTLAGARVALSQCTLAGDSVALLSVLFFQCGTIFSVYTGRCPCGFLSVYTGMWQCGTF